MDCRSEGPSHSNYHASRGAVPTLDINLLLLRAAIKSPRMTRDAWGLTTLCCHLLLCGLAVGMANLGASCA